MQENVTCALFTLYFVKKENDIVEAVNGGVDAFTEWISNPETQETLQEKTNMLLNQAVFTKEYAKSYYYQIKTFKKWCAKSGFDASTAKYIQHNTNPDEPIVKRVEGTLSYFNNHTGDTGFPLKTFKKDNYQKADIYAVREDPAIEGESALNNEIQYWAANTKSFIGISLKVIDGGV